MAKRYLLNKGNIKEKYQKQKIEKASKSQKHQYDDKAKLGKMIQRRLEHQLLE